MQTEQVKPKKAVIRWDENEWDKLFELVYAMRRNTPEDSISSMANRAQKQFPKDRQRPGILATAALGPLIDRVKKRDRELQVREEKCGELSARLTFFEELPTTREELLRTLNDEEIRAHFLPRLLQMLAPVDVVSGFSIEALLDAIETPDLAAVVAKRFVVDLTKRQVNVTVQMPEQRSPARILHPPKNTNGHSNGRRKKIVIIGTKGDQPRHLSEKVGTLVELTCIGVEKLHRESVPRNADHVILWSKFVSHDHRQMVFSAVEPRKISEHFDGLTELVEFIEGLCGLGVVAAK